MEKHKNKKADMNPLFFIFNKRKTDQLSSANPTLVLHDKCDKTTFYLPHGKRPKVILTMLYL